MTRTDPNTRRRLVGLCVAAVTGLAALTTPQPGRAADPIRVGEINSYTRLPAFTEPYRLGWKLALEQINAAGGIDGRPLEVIDRDDAGNPGDAVTAANELVTREGVDLLMGTFFSHVGLAVSDFAHQRDVFFMAAEPLSDALVWSKGTEQTFRLRPSTSMQARMLAEEAATLGATRWAAVAPNYEYGKSAVEAFQAALEELQPGVEWVETQWPPLGKIDAGATAQALARSNPDAIFNVTFGPDLTKFVREGNTRGLFKDTAVVSLLTGEPEYLMPLGAEAPEGWIVTGYPWRQIDTPEHTAFLNAYRERWAEEPRVGSVVGYAAMKSVAAILEVAGSTKTDALIAAARGIEVDMPFGRIRFRAADHQSTMGAFVGRTAVRDGEPMMVDFRYVDGAEVLPPEDEARALRPE